MTRKGFLFMTSYYDSIKELNETDQLALFHAICQYGCEGNEVELEGLPKIIFGLIKPTLSASIKRYDSCVENGKRGGRPPQKEPTDNQQSNPTETNPETNKVTNNETQTEPTTKPTPNLNKDKEKERDKATDKAKEISETSSPVKTRKRTGLEEQLLSYINSLEYTDETRQALIKWMYQLGLKGNVTVQQLKDKLEYIWNIYDDESLVRQSIEEAYRNNWFGFFPLKNRPSVSPATLEKKEPSSFTTKYQDNNYSDENSRPARQKQQGCWNITY